jgi:hypothetical protein
VKKKGIRRLEEFIEKVLYKATKDTTVQLKSMGNSTSQDGGVIDVLAISKEEREKHYIQYGGSYAGDIKDTPEFRYIEYKEYPKFGIEHKSLMAKHLTPELFEKLKDLKTSKGYTLSNVIMTGVVTPHLGVGATAGDEESWEVFKDLFYPIVNEWHGYDPSTQKHPVSAASKMLLCPYGVNRASTKVADITLPKHALYTTFSLAGPGSIEAGIQ